MESDALFTPKQKDAYVAMGQYKYVLYGGARGGGKSRWLRWALLGYLIENFRNTGIKKIRVMLASETYETLLDRQINKIEVEFPRAFGKIKTTKRNGLSFYLNENLGGGILAFRNLDDPFKYQSSEFAAIGVDELTKNPKKTFDVLRGSLRYPGIPHTPFIAATNPGGIGHSWVKDLWVDKNFDRYPELRKDSKHFYFLQSLPKDNPYLPNEYWDMLNSLPENLRKAWVQGNWDSFDGMAFPGFNRNKHVLPKPITLPDYYPRWRAIDWGFTSPFCCLWLCKDPQNGRIFIYRELYEKNLTDLQQARTISELSPSTENLRITYADPSMWARKNLKNEVSSSADEYRNNGIPLTKGDNDRLSGKRKIDRLLENLEDGYPGLLFFPSCKNLIRTIGSLALSNINVEDVDNSQEDHAYDALRYGLTKKERHAVTETRYETESPIARIMRETDLF